MIMRLSITFLLVLIQPLVVRSHISANDNDRRYQADLDIAQARRNLLIRARANARRFAILARQAQNNQIAIVPQTPVVARPLAIRRQAHSADHVVPSSGSSRPTHSARREARRLEQLKCPYQPVGEIELAGEIIELNVRTDEAGVHVDVVLTQNNDQLVPANAESDSSSDTETVPVGSKRARSTGGRRAKRRKVFRNECLADSINISDYFSLLPVIGRGEGQVTFIADNTQPPEEDGEYHLKEFEHLQSDIIALYTNDDDDYVAYCSEMCVINFIEKAPRIAALSTAFHQGNKLVIVAVENSIKVYRKIT